MEKRRMNEKMSVNLEDHLITATQKTDGEGVIERKEKIVLHWESNVVVKGNREGKW